MPSLSQRLLSIEEEFLNALTAGDEALIAFEHRWEVLLADVDAALDSSALDSSTSNLAHATAIRIATLAEISAELSSTCDVFTSQLFGQLSDMMSDLTLTDSVATESTSCTKRNPLKSTSRKRRCSSSSVDPPLKRKWYCTRSERTSVIPPDVVNAHPHIIPTASAQIQEGSSCTSEVHTPTRKRRRSDADTTAPRGVKRLHAGPRVHAVSDSYLLGVGPIPSYGDVISPPSPILNPDPLAQEVKATSFDIQPFDTWFSGFDSLPQVEQISEPPRFDLWEVSSESALLLPEFSDMQDAFKSLLDTPVCVSTPNSAIGLDMYESGSSTTASSPSPSTPRSTHEHDPFISEFEHDARKPQLCSGAQFYPPFSDHAPESSEASFLDSDAPATLDGIIGYKGSLKDWMDFGDPYSFAWTQGSSRWPNDSSCHLSVVGRVVGCAS